MPGPLPELIESLLWCAAGLMLAYLFLPMFFMMLGQTRVTFAVLGGPEAAQPTDNDPQYADLYERLRNLGFEPLGSRREIGWFANGHWYKRSLPGRIWATPGRDCFVSLYRLFPDEPWRLAFSTIFTDGSAVQTANQMTRLRIEEPDYLRQACPSPDLSEVLRQHRQTAEDFRATWGRVVAAPDLPEALERLCHHSERHLRKIGPKLGLVIMQTPLFFLGVATCSVGSYFGFGNWTTAAALLLGGAIYKLAKPRLRRIAAENLRDEDRKRAFERQWERRRAAPPSRGITARNRTSGDDERITGGPAARS